MITKQSGKVTRNGSKISGKFIKTPYNRNYVTALKNSCPSCQWFPHLSAWFVADSETDNAIEIAKSFF